MHRLCGCEFKAGGWRVHQTGRMADLLVGDGGGSEEGYGQMLRQSCDDDGYAANSRWLWSSELLAVGLLASATVCSYSVCIHGYHKQLQYYFLLSGLLLPSSSYRG